MLATEKTTRDGGGRRRLVRVRDPLPQRSVHLGHGKPVPGRAGATAILKDTCPGADALAGDHMKLTAAETRALFSGSGDDT